jgi:hypothetical protein
MIAFGDLLERLLRNAGITKERVQAAVGARDCGCAKRQQAMNKWGFAIQQRLLRPFFRFRDIAFRLRYTIVAMRAQAALRHIFVAFRILFYGY